MRILHKDYEFTRPNRDLSPVFWRDYYYAHVIGINYFTSEAEFDEFVHKICGDRWFVLSTKERARFIEKYIREVNYKNKIKDYLFPGMFK